VARRGAREVSRRDDDGVQRTQRFSEDQDRRTTAPPSKPTPWKRSDGSRDEWQDTPRSTGKSRKSTGTDETAPSSVPAGPPISRKPLPVEVAAEIRKAAAIATALHRERLVEKAESAYGAYMRNRFQDAYRAIKPVAEEVPTVAGVRELAGLSAYRSGKWRDALRHLQAYSAMSDSTEHIPVLMDCQRALRKPKKVAELWTELRQLSPDPDVLSEGRMVAAGSLAEMGDLTGAIALLSSAGATKALRNPSNRHIRQWYLLADFYERAGDVPRAREFFERVAKVDREAYDVLDRLNGLGPERRPRPSSSGRKAAAPRAAAVEAPDTTDAPQPEAPAPASSGVSSSLE
jgi:tetratricopeptide (TPR) repeat protein